MPSFIWRPRALLLCVLSGTAQAEPAAAPLPSPSSVAVLAGACISCHGPYGRSATSIPSIAGQTEGQLRARLLAFKNDTAAGATIMTRLMKGYDEQQIGALAQWFAQERR